MNQLVWNTDRKTWIFVAEKPKTRALTVRQRTRFREMLLGIYGPNCWLCNRRIVDQVPTLDHVEPRALGGVNRIENLRLAHERCNQKRGCGPVPELLLTRAMRHAPGSKPLVETTQIGSIAKQREPDQRPNIGNYPTKPVE